MSTDSLPPLSTIDEAVDALRAGRPVIVADDADRENEGDLILSAELASPEQVGVDGAVHVGLPVRADARRSGPTASICRRWSRATKICAERHTPCRSMPPSA